MKKNKNIILFGVPRSGTTWISEILTYKNDIELIHEPDNELNSFLGLYYKQGLNRFPYIWNDITTSQIDTLFNLSFNKKIRLSDNFINTALYRLYKQSRDGLNKNLKKSKTALIKKLPFSKLLKNLLIRGTQNNRVLVKTVHSLLLLPYLKKKLTFTPVIIRRNPLNIFSSYMKMNMPDKDRELYFNYKLLKDYRIAKPDKIVEKNISYRSGFQLGVFSKVINKYENDKNYSDTLFLDYENIIGAPFTEIESLCKKLSINYTNDMEEFMKSKFKEGSGYQTNRVLTDHDRIWKKRLTPEQINDFISGYVKANDVIDFKY